LDKKLKKPMAGQFLSPRKRFFGRIEHMTRNKKIIILGIGILIILFVLVSITDLKYSLCFDHYTIDCWRESKLIQVSPPSLANEEYIPCSNSNDCSVEIMQNFCIGGHPNLLKCDGARYYCGNDGCCKS